MGTTLFFLKIDSSSSTHLLYHEHEYYIETMCNPETCAKIVMKLSEKYPDIFAELSEEINSGTSLITFYILLMMILLFISFVK